MNTIIIINTILYLYFVLLTSFLHVSLVIDWSESSTFISQQCHQSLRDHKIWGGDELVFLSYTPQEAG